jgi:putative transposase
MKTFKYRIYPNKTQLKTLTDTLETCRHLYNTCLEERITLYETEKKSTSAYTQINNHKISENVHSQVVQHVIFKLDNAFKQFFTRVKKGDTPGFPRFKGKNRMDSFCYPQSGFKLLDNKHLRLSKIGDVKIKLHQGIVGKIKCLIIKRNSLDQWFACFSVDDSEFKLPNVEIKSSIGLDLGCESFITLSNGEKVKHPHYYKKTEKKLKALQSKYSKRKTSKSKRQLQKLHNKVQNQRSDFTHKLSRSLVNSYDLICIEDLNILSMVGNNLNNLNKSILDSGWRQFSDYLSYKAEDAGKKVIKVNPAYTSQICSDCGTLVKKDLSERTHKCSCGLILDRDHNAAINILSFGTKLFKSQ